MYIIGITGGTGSGKSSAVQALKALSAHALDCDMIYHDLLLHCDDMKAELENRFDDILTDNIVDRRKLSEIVWNDPQALQELNVITHKYVVSEIDNRINTLKGQGVSIVVIDAIALIESGQGEKCDVIVGVVAPEEKRVSRIMNRDKLPKEQAQMRINAQQPESFYKNNCDYMLENTYDTQAEFKEKCNIFFKELLRKTNLKYCKEEILYEYE